MSGEGSDIAGLRVLIVGASSGIGHAVAVRAAERGAKVAVAARRTDLLEALAEQIGGTAFELDVEDPAAIGRVVDAAAEALVGFDAVVFTSTVAPMAHIEDDTTYSLSGLCRLHHQVIVMTKRRTAINQQRDLINLII